MSSRDFAATSGRIAKILSRKSKYPYKRESYCTEQSNVLLGGRNTDKINKDMDTIMNTFKNKKNVYKTLCRINDKSITIIPYKRKNNIKASEISESLIDKFLHIYFMK